MAMHTKCNNSYLKSENFDGKIALACWLVVIESMRQLRFDMQNY